MVREIHLVGGSVELLLVVVVLPRDGGSANSAGTVSGDRRLLKFGSLPSSSQTKRFKNVSVYSFLD